MIVFDSACIFVESRTSNEAKVAAIDLIIDALMSVALKMAANQTMTEYSLNDGQTIIKVIYRDSAAVYRSINDFEKLKQMYMNRINGRMVRLVDGKNFIRGHGFNFGI